MYTFEEKQIFRNERQKRCAKIAQLETNIARMQSELRVEKAMYNLLLEIPDTF